ncbi:Class II aldolase/adducin family protein [Aphelenchoides bicaudatus]|nr:Class II aldolase/adducin family protein [Aphelenchoides bicaudatus]
MVNKPCSRVCARTGQSRLPSAYRSRSAGSLPRRRIPPNHDYAQYLFNIDGDYSELEKELQRPAVIQEDLYEMDRRKRVQEILQAQRVLCRTRKCDSKRQANKGSRASSNCSSVSSNNNDRASQYYLHINSTAFLESSAQVKPIADLTNNNKYTSVERILRNKLACLYRLVDLFQWSQGIYNHLTLRLPHKEDKRAEILINPFGLLYSEITSSSLIKLSLEGEILDNGSTTLGINQAGYILHSAIHTARPDVKCVLHLHTPVVSAVSSMKCGLLPISQESMIIGPVAYHDFQGIVCDEKEQKSIVDDLGDKNVMILRNHGFVACGQSVEDALHLAFHLIIACETQIRAARVGIENLIIPSKEAAEKAYKIARHGGGGNFKTGHVYRKPSLKFRMEPPSYSALYLSEVATPPTSSARGRLEAYSADTMSKRDKLRKQLERTNWLNSPNNYLKIHVLDCSSNTNEPKTVTKWVSDLSHGGTPVKISSVHQFSSLNGDTKEFQDKQRQLKDTRMAGKTSAGPTSQFVDTFISEDQTSPSEPTADFPQIRQPYIIYTASKGVLDRKHQEEGQLHSQYFLRNPFITESDNDIQTYLKEIESKQRTASAMEQSQFSYNVDSPPDSPTTRERSKSFEFDTASLMQGNGNEFTEGTIEVPQKQTKRRKGFRISKNKNLLIIWRINKMSSHSKVITLEGKSRLPARLQDSIIDVGNLVDHIANSETVQLSQLAKNFSVLEGTMNNTLNTLKKLDKTLERGSASNRVIEQSMPFVKTTIRTLELVDIVHDPMQQIKLT